MIGKKFLAFSLTAAILAGSAMSASAAGVKDVFDANTYAGKYSDVKATYGTDVAKLIEHFKAFGAKEGRVMSPILDVVAYRNAYADLNAAFGDNWDAYVDHYLTNGIKEKRTTGVLFDLVDYANKNADVKAAFGEDYAAIAQHYINYGIKEGRPGGVIATASATTSSSSSSDNSGSTTQTPAKPSTPAPTTPVETTPTEHEHHWVKDGSKSGTCTENGYQDWRCDIPKTYNVKDDKGNIIGIEEVKVNGEVVYCDARKRDVTPKAHVPATDGNGNKVNYYCIPATCLATGVEKYTCARCGAHIDNVLPKVEHVLEYDHTVAPKGCTPELRGYDVYVCYGGCGKTEKRNETSTDHQVATHDINVTPSTCYSMGVAYGYCSKCKELVPQALPLLGHENETRVVYVDSYTKNESAPCHTKVVLEVCKVCGLIDNVDDSYGVEACQPNPDDKDYCDTCQRSLNRNRTNQVMQYIEGNILNDNWLGQ